MEIKKGRNSNTLEKILLASIPVIGSIIIAFIAANNSQCNPPSQKTDTDYFKKGKEEKRIIALKLKAGKINDHVVYSRYDDLYPMLAIGFKPYVTRKIFNVERDSIKNDLGEFIKPIDTAYSKAFGNDNFFINNQYQRGSNIVTITFDQDGMVLGLITKHVQN